MPTTSPDSQFPPNRPASQNHRSRYGRSNHRAAQHDSAHASDEPVSVVPDHPLIFRGAPHLVVNNRELRQLLDHVLAEGSFAYDSEFIGELTYVPKLCLIQVATKHEIALIDPLSQGIDLDPFWDVLCDPSVEKIVHAGQQDVEPVVRVRGCSPANLFDTQLAGGFCGMTYPTALSRLVQESIGAKIGKGLTFTHWDQRPLSAQQMRYAADDVRYLPALREALGQLLDENGHAHRAAEEFAALCEPSQYRFDPKTYYLRVRGAGGLGAQELAILRELSIWRDAAARAEDVPPRSLLKDEILVDMARTPIRSAEKFARVRGLPRPVEESYGQQIIEATRRGLETPATDLPEVRHYEPSPRERFTADAIWAIVQTLCIGRSIDPNLVTNRQEVGELARPLLAGETLPDSPLLKGWRKELVADPLVELLSSTDFKLELAWDAGRLVAQAKAKPHRT